MATFGMSFGNPTTSAPAFGSTTGFTFGNTTTQPSNTGFTFGNPATTTTAPSTGFTFGAVGTSAPSSAPFSFSGIGATTTTSAPSFGFGGFGSTTTTASTGFSFGQPTGSTLGGGGIFSSGMGLQPLGNAPQNALTGPTTSVDNVTNLVTALTCPMLYGDERDTIIAKWNQLQASWGTGKGYFSPNAPPIEFTPQNPFCCFKAIGYSCLPGAKAEEGIVGLIFQKKVEELQSQQQQLSDSLHRCFGSKPTITVTIDGIKPLPDDKSEVVFYLTERLPTGPSRRVPSNEICSYMEQPHMKNQLSSVGVMNIVPKTQMSKEQLEYYLDNPPAGIEPIVWKQAKLDNPDPERLIPTPMVGFQHLSHRMKCQEYETKQHQMRLDVISDDIAELNRNHSTTVAKIAEHKRKLSELQHRVLKILVHQEIIRKMGYAIQADEEQLRIKFEAIQAELSAPTQFKGHLKELTSQIRMQNYQMSSLETEKYHLDEVTKEEIKEQLLSQQEGIALLMNIIKEDMANLKIIEEISKDALSRRR